MKNIPAWRILVILRGALALLCGLCLLGWLLLFVLLPGFHIGAVCYVPNQAMSPVIQRGDRVYMNELAYRHEPPGRGEVVFFRGEGLPTLVHTKEWQVKRIAGLPGETLSIRGRTLYVGDRPAPGISGFRYQIFDFDRFLTWENDSFTVPAGSYFVLGDFPDGSYDSRFLGPIPMDHIKGRAVFRLWPLSRLGWVR